MNVPKRRFLTENRKFSIRYIKIICKLIFSLVKENDLNILYLVPLVFWPRVRAFDFSGAIVQ